MDKLVVGIIAAIILMGVTFWIFNNPNGIGEGLDNGAENIKVKIEDATSQ
ncbi:hypothetical protein [Paenibacillus gansuensis]|uniref:Uncharacterized protein n=1 Tax=Paenibacillus gansuensis TaxID=306542 RepID=A0ABW5PK42_9BACL